MLSPPASSPWQRVRVVLVLGVVWVAVFLVALAWWTPHPKRLPWLAVLGFLLWVLIVIGGSIAFGG